MSPSEQDAQRRHTDPEQDQNLLIIAAASAVRAAWKFHGLHSTRLLEAHRALDTAFLRIEIARFEAGTGPQRPPAPPTRLATPSSRPAPFHATATSHHEDDRTGW